MSNKLNELQTIQLNILKEFDALCKENNIPYFIIGGSTIGCVRHKGFIPWDDDIDVGLLRPDYDKFVELAYDKWKGRIQVRNYKFTEGFYHSLTHAVDTQISIMDESRINAVKANVWIDVNPLDGFPTNFVSRKIHYYYLRIIKNMIVLSQFDSLFDKNKKRSKVASVAISIIQKINFFTFFNTKKLIEWLEKILRKYDPYKSKYVGNFLGRYGQKEIMEKTIFDEMLEMPFEDIFVPVMKDYDTYLRNLYGDYMQLPTESERINRHGMRIIEDK